MPKITTESTLLERIKSWLGMRRQDETHEQVPDRSHEAMTKGTRTFVTSHVLGGNVPVGKADTKTLVVGQHVYMFSGCYVNQGKVVEVTPSGVEVQTSDELLHFDNNGRSYVTELPSSYDSTAHPLSPWGWKGNGTYECGPWYIDGMPFEEREALYEEGARKRQKWITTNCEPKHNGVGLHYYIEKCPICGCENPNYKAKTSIADTPKT